ncbi:MAG TPA: RNA polymerase factor sigma-54, partial [Elusimicrobiota bacterium]|nr:RNA polymerase factor sigma-54 [Elusimicrobiota bacterium]
MVQGLQLSTRLTQSLVLAPQLQQSLALLQAPTLELKALVEQELQQNPVLEEMAATDAELKTEHDDPAEAPDAPEAGESPEDAAFEGTSEKGSEGPETAEGAEAPADDFQQEFDKLVQLDQEWRDHFSQTNIPMRASAEEEEKRQFMFDSLAAGTSFAQTLMDQVRETDLNEDQRAIAELIIGNIDDYGYLKATIEEMSAANNLPADKITEVLKVIRTFDPPGVAAIDLRECLMLQLERAGQQESLEYRIVRDYMEALGKRRIPEIARGTGCTVEDVQAAIGRIGRLEPRPGRAFLPDANQYVLPEVFVQRVGDEYVVTTNDEHIPHLRISNIYKDLMSQGGNSAEVKNYIREKIRAGKFLIKSLHQRQQTILNIGKQIVKRQRDFMEKGVSHLKPLIMAQIAEAVGVHETTVSRAVSGKYMQTPQGVFEMKYFFTGGLQTASGENVSNTSVKDMIAEIFKNEDPAKPLSDHEVVKMLSEKGIVIARRTVAK